MDAFQIRCLHSITQRPNATVLKRSKYHWCMKFTFSCMEILSDVFCSEDFRAPDWYFEAEGSETELAFQNEFPLQWTVSILEFYLFFHVHLEKLSVGAVDNMYVSFHVQTIFLFGTFLNMALNTWQTNVHELPIQPLWTYLFRAPMNTTRCRRCCTDRWPKLCFSMKLLNLGISM